MLLSSVRQLAPQRDDDALPHGCKPEPDTPAAQTSEFEQHWEKSQLLSSDILVLRSPTCENLCALAHLSQCSPPHTPVSTLFFLQTAAHMTGTAERRGGLTVQILRPGQVNHSVADLSFVAQLAKVVPDAVEVDLLLLGTHTQIRLD